MNEVLNYSLAVILGLILGGAGVSLVLWMWRSGYLPTRGGINPVPEGVRSALDVIGAGAVVVNKNDLVLSATKTARQGGFVEYFRLIHEPLLELTREVRNTKSSKTLDTTLPVGPLRTKAMVTVKAAALNDGCVILLIEDRTESIRLDETRRDFVANVSHELKTPISSLALLAEVINQSPEDTATVAKFSNSMLDETKRLNLLVQDIILLSRVQSADVAHDARPVELNGVIQDAANRNRVLADGKKIEIKFLATEPVTVFGDYELLTSAVKNLIENAVTYSDPGTHVGIGLRTSRGVAEVAVTDNGIGISQEDLPRIFERFYRADTSRSRSTGGTGLGLAITKNIAVKHGGELRVFSKLGLGSTFTLSLPTLKKKQQLADEESAE